MSEIKEIQSNNRWWESYLVRYFLGFIVGAVCVVIILQYVIKLPSRTFFIGSHEVGSGSTSGIIVISLLGLAYCYIASTPISVLHAGRYGKGRVDSLSRFFWFGWAISLFFLMFPLGGLIDFLVSFDFFLCFIWFGGGAVVVLGIFIYSYKGNKNFEYDFLFSSLFTVGFVLLIFSFSITMPYYFDLHPSLVRVRVWAVGVPVVWIGLVQYFVLFRILSSKDENNEFYKKLFYARRMEGARDVRDTYSHLREHSNAIFIVAVEIAILALFVGGFSDNEYFYYEFSSTILMEKGFYWLLILGFWIVPTIFMWSRANAMEKDFSNDPDLFVPEKSRTKINWLN